MTAEFTQQRRHNGLLTSALSLIELLLLLFKLFPPVLPKLSDLGYIPNNNKKKNEKKNQKKRKRKR